MILAGRSGIAEEYSLLSRARVFRRNCFEALHYTLPLIDNTRNKQKICRHSRERLPDALPAVSCLRCLRSARDGTGACLKNSTTLGGAL